MAITVVVERGVPLFMVLLAIVGCGHHLYHRVQPGDTLYSISWQYGHDFREIVAWNDLPPPYLIREGQIIQLVPPKKEQQWTLLSKSHINDHVAAVEVEPAENADKPVLNRQRVVTQPKTPPAQPRVVLATPPSSPLATPALSDAPVKWRWPAEGRLISTFKGTGTRKGVDIAGKLGQPIRAAAGGRVVYSGNGLKGYGNLIIIKHGEDYLSAYAHNRDIFVTEGEPVQQGQKIGEMGPTSNNQVALYFEIRQEGKPVNPLRFLPPQ